MRFDTIRYNGLTVVDFPILGATPQDVYICKGVDGLGVEIDISMADTLNAGGFYQGRHFHDKEITALIGLNPNYSAGEVPGDLRTNIYGLLSPGMDDHINIQFVDDETVVAAIRSYVSKVEYNPFSDTPEVQIISRCDSPFLTAPDELFVEPESKPSPSIENTGNAPVGFHMEVQFTADLPDGWILQHVASGKKMEFDYAFLTGDLLTIDTRPGNRGIWVTRVGVTSNIIYSLTEDSIWFMLHGGVNSFATSSSAFDWGDVFFLPQFWGI